VNPETQDKNASGLNRWRQQNAILLVMGLIGVLLEHSSYLIGLMALASFLALTIKFKHEWALAQRHLTLNILGLIIAGMANSILLIPNTITWWPLAAALSATFIHGISLQNQSPKVSHNSTLGYTDTLRSEASALLLLALCCTLYTKNIAGAWILIAAGYHYLPNLRAWDPDATSTRFQNVTTKAELFSALLYALCLTYTLPFDPMILITSATGLLTIVWCYYLIQIKNARNRMDPTKRPT